MIFKFVKTDLGVWRGWGLLRFAPTKCSLVDQDYSPFRGFYAAWRSSPASSSLTGIPQKGDASPWDARGRRGAVRINSVNGG